MALLICTPIILFVLLLLRWKTTATQQFQVKPIHTSLGFTFIIPFKDEGQRVVNLALALHGQRFNNLNYRVVFVDDHSVDGATIKLDQVLKEGMALIPNRGIGKKSAIETGISFCTDPWIVTLDADIEISPNFIQDLQKMLNPEFDMILFPIATSKGKNWIQKWANREFTLLQVITKWSALYGKPQFSNGACLAFKKSIFEQVNGYQRHKDISSGDDQLLLADVWAKTGKVGYASHFTNPVITCQPTGLKDFFQQRSRWGTKAKFYRLNHMVQFVVLSIVAQISLLLTWLFLEPLELSTVWLVYMITVQYFIGTNLKEKEIASWILFLVLYPFVLFVNILFALIFPIHWKGRKIKS